MEYVILVLLVLVLGGGYLWLRKRRRENTPVEDDWPGLPGVASRPTEILNRDALASRGREADLGQWDDSPDETPPPKPKPKPDRPSPAKGAPKPDARREPAAEADDVPPAVLDRDFLKGRRPTSEPLEWPED